jgi:hypothetical protein
MEGHDLAAVGRQLTCSCGRSFDTAPEFEAHRRAPGASETTVQGVVDANGTGPVEISLAEAIDRYGPEVVAPLTGAAGKGPASTWKYDVALSFAGEQREYVEKVAVILRAHGVSVFYDAYEKAVLWGKNLFDHLSDVYQNQARYAVVFASAEYAAKAWTKLERQSAQARALNEKREYVLPARFDETDIPGIPSTVGYIDLRTTTPEELAGLIIEKLTGSTSGSTSPQHVGPAAEPSTATDWCARHRSTGLEGLAKAGKTSFYEVCASVSPPLPAQPQRALLDAVANNNIDTFGWPIGVVLQRDPYRPRPIADGVVATVHWEERATFDYWALGTTGDFYLAKTLSEDALGHPDKIFFNTRIVRVAETVMFLSRLYLALGADPDSTVRLTVRHTGLAGRPLQATASRGFVFHRRTTIEQEMSTTSRWVLSAGEKDLVTIVKQLLAPLFQVYEFFEVSDEVLRDVVERFVAGEVT